MAVIHFQPIANRGHIHIRVGFEVCQSPRVPWRCENQHGFFSQHLKTRYRKSMTLVCTSFKAPHVSYFISDFTGYILRSSYHHAQANPTNEGMYNFKIHILKNNPQRGVEGNMWSHTHSGPSGWQMVLIL